MITAADYKNIVCFMMESETMLSKAYSALLNVQQTLSDTDVSDTKRAFLQQPLTDAMAKLAAQITDPLPELLAAVSALQRHVQTNYGSVNGFLAANSLTVPEAFADISAAAGYTINSIYIAESC